MKLANQNDDLNNFVKAIALIEMDLEKQKREKHLRASVTKPSVIAASELPTSPEVSRLRHAVEASLATNN